LPSVSNTSTETGAVRDFASYLIPIAVFALACPTASVEPQISRDQAIEIARVEVSFTPDSVDAVLTDSLERWVVTFRGRLPGQPPGLFETRIVEVDTQTGEIVSIART